MVGVVAVVPFLLLLLVAGSLLLSRSPEAPSEPTSSAGTSAPQTLSTASSTIPPTTQPDGPSAEIALADLRPGDCFNAATGLLSEKADQVPCTEPHSDEVAGVIMHPAATDAAYPGVDAILDIGKRECPPHVAAYYGAKEAAEATQVFVFGPNQAAWEAGERAVACTLREPSGARRTGSYLDG